MANEYISRKITKTGNRRQFTYSCWIKSWENNLSSMRVFLASSGGSSEFSISVGNEPQFGSVMVYDYNPTDTYEYVYQTSKRPVADKTDWHHLVVAVDTTLDLEDDRFKIYVDGVRIHGSATQSGFAQETVGIQNYQTRFSTAGEHMYFGFIPAGGSNYAYKGCMFDAYLVDGVQHDCNVFGYFKDTQNKNWVPRSPAFVKQYINNNGGFGTNGIYLPMNDGAAIGADYHCDYNNILKIQDDKQQPRASLKTDPVNFSEAVNDDPYKDYLVLALPLVDNGSTTPNDYSGIINPAQNNKGLTVHSLQFPKTSAGGRTPYYGSSCYFDGTNSGIEVSNIGVFETNQDFTVETWLYLQTGSDDTGNSVFGDYGVGNLGNSMQLIINKNNRRILLYQNNYIAQSPDNTIQTAQWHHICLERYNNVVTIYVDGVSQGSAQFSGQLGNQTSKWIGYDYPGGGSGTTEHFQGYMSDFRIYKGIAKYKGGFDTPKPFDTSGWDNWRAVPDTTSNVFATLATDRNQEDLTYTSSAMTYTNGGLTAFSTGSLAYLRQDIGTIGTNSGKWYYEVRIEGSSPNHHFGFWKDDYNNISTYPSIYFDWGSFGSNSVVEKTSGTQSGTAVAYTVGDVMGAAIDFDENIIRFYRNGSLILSLGDINHDNSVLHPVVGVWTGSQDAQSTVNVGQNPTFCGATSPTTTYTDANGYGEFMFKPPEGHLSYCKANLDEPAIKNPSDHFDILLYKGDGVNYRPIKGLKFKPDLVLIKARDVGYNPRLFDSVRGTSSVDNYLIPSRTDPEGGTNDRFGGLSSFDQGGFTIVDGTGGSNIGINQSGNEFVAWCWKAGDSIVTNNDGTITSNVSVNQTAGFSIASYTGDGNGSATIGHGLGQKPSVSIFKRRDGTASSWPVINKTCSPDPYTDTTVGLGSRSSGVLSLNLTGGNIGYTMDQQTNTAGASYISYHWADIPGFSQSGLYNASGREDSDMIYTGFRPKFLLVKRWSNSSAYSSWALIDSARSNFNRRGGPVTLWANLNAAEGFRGNGSTAWGYTVAYFDFYENGFKCRDGNSDECGDNNDYYFYMAFAEHPYKY